MQTDLTPHIDKIKQLCFLIPGTGSGGMMGLGQSIVALRSLSGFCPLADKGTHFED